METGKDLKTIQSTMEEDNLLKVEIRNHKITLKDTENDLHVKRYEY